MLDKQLKKTIQEAYSTFLDKRGLKARYGQKMMIAEVARTLAAIEQNYDGDREGGNHICVTEAGTGTGKTMAYLLAAVPIAQHKKKKVVVSTATVALQEQLILKDLPQLISDAGVNLTFGLAKGRGRYFCVSSAEKALEQQNELGQIALYEDEAVQKIGKDDVEEVKQLLSLYASGEWDGDRDALPDTVAENIWRLSTSDHLQCTNRRCSNFSICPFFKARQELDKWDLIVANHDLVLADLSLGGGAILSEPGDTIYIFDEGHHLSTKTTGHFSYSLRLKSSQRWLSKTTRSLNKLLNDASEHIVLRDYVEKLSNPFADMERSLEEWSLLIQQLLEDKLQYGDRYRFAQGMIPESLQLICHNFATAAERVVLKFEQIVDLLKEAMDGELADLPREMGEKWYPQMGILLSRMQAMYWLARSYSTPDGEGSIPKARWINRVDGAEGLDLECRSSPVSAAETLQEHLWEHCYAAVITSATLTALGRFDRLYADLGLPFDSPCSVHLSPFDFQNSAELIVPSMKTDPGNPDLHNQELSDYLEKLLPAEQACLVLFSSWRQMRYVLEQMPDNIVTNTLVQGDLAKHEILRQHRERIDNNEPSIIFGLASFAEGVDLPGDYLTHVVVTKLPFGVPDDPVDATYSEWIESQGRNPFEEWVIPMASMRLTQATGRLLRTEQDKGKITLLDRRFITRRYGKQLLAALPPYRRNFS
ncbi:ATP-dependent DNA helicase DinG [Neptuniibacter sp.]|uniref:ATP-dependent DNA helicase DinG n=1 Tax=Neptuniibacter sp. TaxID=1962643 RepID=UPI0026030AAB|nr:ATP-dependent DNA helicase DinG [Neptuniibacter sp.]MCP4598209.1 ATP-dependent DNA helicase DinG [Neptuniibacter sp.]